MVVTGDAPVPTAALELDALYRSRYAGLVRQARMIVGSLAVAEELVQEAFARLQVAWERADDPGAYVHRIVINLCHSWCARHDRERAYRAALQEPVAIAAEHDDTWVALLRLPIRHRTALVLRYYADMAEAEIATAMECPLGTVKSLIHRGLDKLRAELGEESR